MKVLAIDCGLVNTGNTALILHPFLEGMRKAGADIERVQADRLNVHACRSEYACWLKTLGECIQRDDMRLLLPKMYEAEVWVFAAAADPQGVPTPLKYLLDRTMPLLQQLLKEPNAQNHSKNHRRKQVVLISGSEEWEGSFFDPLLVQMADFCRINATKFAGALLRPQGKVLSALLNLGVPPDDVFDSAENAGRELVLTGRISRRTREKIGCDLIPPDLYLQSWVQEILGLEQWGTFGDPAYRQAS